MVVVFVFRSLRALHCDFSLDSFRDGNEMLDMVEGKPTVEDDVVSTTEGCLGTFCTATVNVRSPFSISEISFWSLLN